MSEQFFFHGQTSFINKPKDTIISNFQNSYLDDDNTIENRVNREFLNLIEVILSTKNIPDDVKEDTVKAIHSVAGQVKERKTNRITLKGTLQVIQEVVSKAADIAAPALSIIEKIMGMIGLS